ncbi:hypothetical protein G9A89_023571 [Geosiphon pyriformis]|nr:hypothetical protein G9A89_023571 [Geosiphon pyriformis]
MAINEILTYQIALNKSGHQAEKEIGNQLTNDESPHYRIFVHYTKNSIKTFRYNTFRILSTEIVFEHQVMGIILQRTSTNNTKPKYSQQLGLNNNHYLAELAFNFYINEKITDFLGRPVNIESARENFYSELIQHTNLPRNHSFAPIIRKINQEIKRYTQKTFPITYQDKGKEKLQTPAVIPKGIQIPNWKKQRIESLIYPSYHHTPGSIINIASADASTRAYSDYFEEFKLRSPTPSGFQSPPYQPDFRTVSPWEITESEEEEDENQEFNYQNPILEDPNIQTQQHLENLEIKTPNIQTLPNQRNQNPKLIHQQNLLPVIIIN